MMMMMIYMRVSVVLLIIRTIRSVDYVLLEPTAEQIRESETRPPILLLPGLVSSRLIAWQHKKCRGPDINIQDYVWLNLQKLAETMTYDHHCWLDCLKLGKNGSDPSDCKVRADEGLGAIGELSPGSIYTPKETSIFTDLIRLLANDLGYDVTSLIGAPYDWRLSPLQLEQRDSFFTTLKHRIETAVKRHKRPAIIIAHSMGNNLFLYFCDWIRKINHPSMGGDEWLRLYIFSYVGYAAPLLGAASSLKSVLSGHTFGIPITDAQARELELTFSSTHLLNPRSSRGKFEYDYKNLVVVKSNGGSQITFGIKDVENGEIFRWMGNMYKDIETLDKYDTLHQFYTRDPLRPLRKVYQRPPIKHVIMIYGVDIDTEVGYTYTIKDDDKPGPPILDEIVYESACPKSTQQQTSSRDVSQELGSGYKSSAASTTDSEGDAESNKSVEYVVERNDAAISDNIGQSEMTSNVHIDRNVSNIIEKETVSRKNKRCKTKIYSMSQKKSINPNHKQRKRHIRDGEQHHSGDFTVPYVSLSYAHTWLNNQNDDCETWVENRPEVTKNPILDTWSPFKISSAAHVYEPAVEIFYSKSKKSDDTTVVFEFQGVDHLDIAKHAYVNTLMLEYLLPKVVDELYLSSKNSLPRYNYDYVSKRKTLYYILKDIIGNFITKCEQRLNKLMKLCIKIPLR